ncbi:hypothetical protein AB0M02_36905 [Actinoplanes sp. NPDC051861]|uniref:hypothetical protein n=1 Tax=Actinoplanes sp. NPDC051861 TaxID=3155170 RepID=UPI00341CB65A
MTLIDTELRAALRAEAAAHRPDREAMLDRITQTAVRRHLTADRRAPRVRIAGAAVAVAALLGGGGFAQWALAGDSDPRPEPPAPTVVPISPAPSDPGPSASPTTPSSSSATSLKSPTARRPSKAAPPSAPVTSAPPPADPAARGPLWSDGSVVPDGDTQGSSVVTIRTSEPLTALEVTIRVARTPELVSRGGSQQVPGASVTSTVTEEPGALVYRFVLSSGDTVEPGTYSFFARYTFAEGGRDARPDVYDATVTTAVGANVTVMGNFS